MIERLVEKARQALATARLDLRTLPRTAAITRHSIRLGLRSLTAVLRSPEPIAG